jgi:MoaA/NifB/PqqE/SkfB family radical SAM enzyme
MGNYLEKKRANLDLIVKTIGERGGSSEDGSFEGKPPLLWLESTARCNLRCGKCGHAVDAPGSARILPRNLPDAVVDEADEYFAAAVKVRTSGYGEMFLFSRLRSLVERIKRYECWVEGTTNGVIIAPSEVDWLVQLGYDQLVFSIDGVEPATMQRLRGADLDRIWDILGYIKGKKEEWNSGKPQIVVGFVAQSDNLHELPALVRKLAEFNICLIAVNTLHYKKYVPGTEDPYGRLYHDCSLANLERGRVEALIEEAREIAAGANIGYNVYIDLDRVYREAAEDADDEDGEFVTLFAEPAPPPPSSLEPFYCVYPWTSLFVTARGSTTVCCSMRGEIGTVLESGDLDRVWNGEPLREIRKAIARGEVHKSCAYCVSRNRHLSSFVDLDAVKAALSAREDVPLPVNAEPEQTPAEPLFGYFDTRDLKAPSAGRLRVSGWMASGRHGTPLRELKLRLDGRELATVQQFYARPDVAAHYGRKDLLNSGWQVTLNLPELAPGEYQLVAEGIDPAGESGTLGPLPVRITG